MYELGLGIAVVIAAASILMVAVALSTHFVFRPLLLELVDRSRGQPRRMEPPAEARLAAVEAELLEVSQQLARLRDAREFDRQLSEGPGQEP